MNPTPHEETLFQAALPLAGAERAAYLERECSGDSALRARLEALLAAHDQPDTLFGTEAGAARPTISLDLARDLADDLVGETIGRYKLLEKIGEGGCGVVYVAEQTEPVRRRVALKIIKLGMDTKQVVARFEAERQALAMMDHPNIAKVFDAGTTDGGKFEVRKSKSEGSPKSESRSPKSESRSPKSEGSPKSESRSPKLGVSTSPFALRISTFALRPPTFGLRTRPFPAVARTSSWNWSGGSGSRTSPRTRRTTYPEATCIPRALGLPMNLPRSADFSPQERGPSKGRPCGLKPALRFMATEKVQEEQAASQQRAAGSSHRLAPGHLRSP
ncbi:MAG: hypothetical protein HS113_21830 [Verrucomicrobiales bacterium]|nr:hypothetical protein [Verrucomicrobiales bacterium]